MNKIISKNAKFTNPITGEEKLFTVKAAITQENIENLLKSGIDIEAMTEQSIKREIDLSYGNQYIDAIIKYAKDKKQTFDVDLSCKDPSFDNNMYKAYKIMHSIYGFIVTCKNPVVYTNAAISSLLSNTSMISGDGYKGNIIDVFCYSIGSKIFKDKDENEIRAGFLCIPLWGWEKTEMIIYDNDNPKKSVFIKFNNLM